MTFLLHFSSLFAHAVILNLYLTKTHTHTNLLIILNSPYSLEVILSHRSVSNNNNNELNIFLKSCINLLYVLRSNYFFNFNFCGLKRVKEIEILGNR